MQEDYEADVEQVEWVPLDLPRFQWFLEPLDRPLWELKLPVLDVADSLEGVDVKELPFFDDGFKRLKSLDSRVIQNELLTLLDFFLELGYFLEGKADPFAARLSFNH